MKKDSVLEVQDFVKDNLESICVECRQFFKTGVLTETDTPLMVEGRDALKDAGFVNALSLLEYTISVEAIKHIALLERLQ